MVDDAFHNFPLLPTELRREIWSYCLPHRVSEVDVPIGYEVYNNLDPGDIPCALYTTDVSNDRPPLLTRVCHESRSIALESGSWTSVLERRDYKLPWNRDEAKWGSENTIDRGYWRDTLRDSAHANWTPSYAILYGHCIGDETLTDLAEEAKRFDGKASFVLEYMTDHDSHLRSDTYVGSISAWLASVSPRRKEDLVALRLLPEWLVVVRVVVVHLDFARAVKTGLFGLLGDESVQVVDVASPLVEQLYELAERCERAAPAITVAQDFKRVDAVEMDALVKRGAIEAYHDREVGERLRPAILFRLCTKMCNHVKKPREEQAV